jgi:hypothetical protein
VLRHAANGRPEKRRVAVRPESGTGTDCVAFPELGLGLGPARVRA